MLEIAPRIAELEDNKEFSLEFLQRIKYYIEEMEVSVDEERGWARNLKQIIIDGDMPKIYDDVLNFIERRTKFEESSDKNQ